jgi:hypothetical protein
VSLPSFRFSRRGARAALACAAIAASIAAAAQPPAPPAPPAPPPPPSSGGPGARHYYSAVWLVVPDRPMEPTKWVGPNRAITSARLLPPRLFRNEADVKTSDGKLLVPAGMNLIGLNSQTVVACASEPKGDRGLAAAWWLGTNRFICLVDENRDRRFESYFSLRTGPQNLITGTGRIPATLNPVAPAAYVEQSPLTFTNAPRIYISYGHFASLVNKLIFKLCLAERRGICLYPDVTTKRDPLPQHFDLLGARFEITAKEGDRLQITQLTEIQPQGLFVR